MELRYDPVKAADLAPYLRMQQEQSQRPMMDLLNMQKLQQGALSMGSLEYAQRQKMEEDRQAREASQMLQQAILPNKDKTGFELDQAQTYKTMLEKGINPELAAKLMTAVGTGTGASAEAKQANALELLNQKLEAAANKKAKSEDSKTNLLKLSETLSKGLYDPEGSQREILTALEMTPENKRDELLSVITKASEQKVPDWHRWVDIGLPAIGAGLGALTGGVGGTALVPGVGTVAGGWTGAGVGTAEGAALAALLTSFDRPENAANPITRDRELDKQMLYDYLSKLPKQ